MILTISGADKGNAAKRKESVVLEQRIPLAEAIIPGLSVELNNKGKRKKVKLLWLIHSVEI